MYKWLIAVVVIVIVGCAKPPPYIAGDFQRRCLPNGKCNYPTLECRSEANYFYEYLCLPVAPTNTQR